MSRIERDLQTLSYSGFSLWIDEHLRFVIVDGVLLPPGFDRRTIPVLIEIPVDYPMTPPGIGGNHIYVPGDLRYQGRKLKDIHVLVGPCVKTPGWPEWAWMCFEDIEWNPFSDDLFVLVETLRTDLTNPRLKQDSWL